MFIQENSARRKDLEPGPPWDPDELSALVDEARRVLNLNDLGLSTKPAPDLYPHLWNWDSGFIAIGLAHLNSERARLELTSLFEGQWDNGMLPQIVFNEDALGNYFPEPDFWRTKLSPHCPSDQATSGITMPPVHGLAVEKIVENVREPAGIKDWLEDIFHKLESLHAYLYRERDHEDEGLVAIHHPWESGIDNSPAWDPPLETIDLETVEIPSYERRDLDHGIPEEQRPDSTDYDRYVHLIDIFRRCRYDDNEISEKSPFLVQDPLFNSILCRSSEALIEIGEFLGKDVSRFKNWVDITRDAIRKKLWDPGSGLFYPYDLVSESLLEIPTSLSFMPLHCGAPTDKQARRLYEHLESHSFCPMHQGHCFSIPNYDMYGKYFEPDNYWRGPVWINVNWLLMHGLRRYDYMPKYKSVRADIVELIRRWGFHEYFHPFEGRGYGTDQFSWSAALFIDVAREILREL